MVHYHQFLAEKVDFLRVDGGLWFFGASSALTGEWYNFYDFRFLRKYPEGKPLSTYATAVDKVLLEAEKEGFKKVLGLQVKDTAETWFFAYGKGAFYCLSST